MNMYMIYRKINNIYYIYILSKGTITYLNESMFLYKTLPNIYIYMTTPKSKPSCSESLAKPPYFNPTKK